MPLEIGVHALRRHDPDRGVWVVAVLVTQTDRPPIVACELALCDRCGRRWRERHRCRAVA